ncbi:hypothetical protein OH77DRAFT_1565600 [Trametes cingulata]|nr:hypothetical protein OH77DRAFT_1565600 [Trametes cingulata]
MHRTLALESPCSRRLPTGPLQAADVVAHGMHSWPPRRPSYPASYSPDVLAAHELPCIQSMLSCARSGSTPSTSLLPPVPTMSTTRSPIDTRLIVGGIYLILFLRPNVEDESIRDFHWGLYHHLSPVQGKKYHIRSADPGWIADHGLASGFMKSFLLIGLVRIGHSDPAEMEEREKAQKTTLASIVESFPLDQVPPGYSTLTCRTWTLHIVKLLNDDPTHYKEVVEWGLMQWDATSDNRQPRPIIDSNVCTLP